MPSWKDLRRYCERDGWELYRETDHCYYRKVLDDGSIRYTAGNRRGMLLHPYDRSEALRLLEGFELVYVQPDPQEEQVFLFRNPPRGGQVDR